MYSTGRLREARMLARETYRLSRTVAYQTTMAARADSTVRGVSLVVPR